MSARKQAAPLHLYMNGRLVGAVEMSRSGAISFAYDDNWLAWENAIPVSLSLPLDERIYKGQTVIAFLENLLPDNQLIRDRVAARVGASGTDAFHLLQKIGRDCVGALQFVPDSENRTDITHSIEGERYTDAQIAATLKNLAAAPLGINENDDFRISIAGAQEKTAFLKINDTWLRPVGMTPTTHIMKTQLGALPSGINLSDSVENEYFCMRFCAHMGARVAHVEISNFEDVRALVIERFDRQWVDDTRLLRLPQEDMCQALSYPPSLKYEADGGPGIVQIADFLKGSDTPAQDQHAFFQAQILFWLLGATDGHAKNFSVALRPSGRFKLTPLYDILTAQKALADGQLSRNQMKMAMCVGDNRHYRIDQIVPRHFLQLAKRTGVGVSIIETLLTETERQIDNAIEATVRDLPDDFPTALRDSTCDGIVRRKRALSLFLQ